MLRKYTSCFFGNLAPPASLSHSQNTHVLYSILLSAAAHNRPLSLQTGELQLLTFRQTLSLSVSNSPALFLHLRFLCRRYTLPLEEFYVNTPNGPNITAYQNGEPESHKTFNCSIHCGGREFCGAGNPGQFDTRALSALPCIDRPSWPCQRIVGVLRELCNC